MITLLVVILVAYVLAKGGQKLISAGMPEEAEYDQESEDRLIRYKAWIRGDGRLRDSGCLDSEHVPMVLFNEKDPTQAACVICRKCSDTLPMPVEYSCDACWLVSVDGYLHLDPCPKHKKEPVTA